MLRLLSPNVTGQWAYRAAAEPAAKRSSALAGQIVASATVHCVPKRPICRFLRHSVSHELQAAPPRSTGRPSTPSNHAFIRATWLPGQYQRPQLGHQVSGQPARATRAGISPAASNAERVWSGVLHVGQRLHGAPAGACAATSWRSASASSPRGTRTAATCAYRRGCRAESVRTVRPAAPAAAKSSSSRAPLCVITSYPRNRSRRAS